MNGEAMRPHSLQHQVARTPSRSQYLQQGALAACGNYSLVAAACSVRVIVRRWLLPVVQMLGAGLMASLIVSVPASAQPFVNWVERMPPPIVPTPRDGHAMVYDIVRGVTVLFGGRDEFALGETWEWNGTAWTQRSSSGPTSRFDCAMAYDSVRGVTVLFGGRNNGFLGDTWEWNGATWSQRLSNGPSPRFGHAMSYDSARGVTVLFGGTNNGLLDDTWEWNGIFWTLRSSGGPPPRTGHAMAWDAARGVTVVFGGLGSVSLGDTWEWNGTSWAERSNAGPTPRDSHAMVYDAARGVTMLFGGQNHPNNYYLGDTWEWNGTTWTERSNAGPTPRGFHAMAYDAARGLTVLFGGLNTAATGDTWELQPGLFLFVDGSNSGLEDGSQTAPFSTVGQALNANFSDTTISIKAGDYAEGPVTFTRRGHVTATHGTVVIH